MGWSSQKLYEFSPDVSMKSDKTRGSGNDSLIVYCQFTIEVVGICLVGFEMILVFYCKLIFHLQCIRNLASLISGLFRQQTDMNIKYREVRMSGSL